MDSDGCQRNAQRLSANSMLNLHGGGGDGGLKREEETQDVWNICYCWEWRHNQLRNSAESAADDWFLGEFWTI